MRGRGYREERGERRGPGLEGPVFLAKELSFVPSGMGRFQGR